MSNPRNVQMGNRILYSKSIEKTKQVHQQRLREISLTSGRVLNGQQNISNNQPELNKKKKEYQQENKNTEIERENRILLEKITNIMATKTTKKFHKPIAAPKSMYLSKRKDQQIQIAKENQIILKRLMEKKPHYDLQLYQQQWQNIKALEQNFYDNHTSIPFSPASAFSNRVVVVPEKNTINNRRQNSAVHSKWNTNMSNINHQNNNSSMVPQANLESYKLPSVPQTAPEGKHRSMSLQRNQQNSSGLYSCKNSSNSLNQSFRGKTPLVRRMSEDRQRLNLYQQQQEQRQYQQQLLHSDCRVINGFKLDIEVYCTERLIIIQAEEVDGTQIHVIEIPRRQGQGEGESGETTSIEGEYIKSLIDRLEVEAGKLRLQQPRWKETQNDNKSNHKDKGTPGNMINPNIDSEDTTAKNKELENPFGVQGISD